MAIFQVYFAKLSESENSVFRFNDTFKKYFNKTSEIAFKINLQAMSGRQQALLLRYEAG